MNTLHQRTDFRTAVERELAGAYAAMTAQGYDGAGRVVGSIGGVVVFAFIDYQPQHPEHGGMVRTLTTKTGYVLVQSMTKTWAELIELARGAIAARFH